MKARPFVFLFLLVLFGLSGAGAAHGAEPWDAEPFSVAPAALLAAAEEVPAAEGGGDVQMLLREKILRFDAEGRLTETHRSIFRLLSPTGVDAWANLAVPWSPWHKERPTVRARVVNAAGKVFELDPATIAETPNDQDQPNVLSDRRQLEVPLPGAQVGALVEQYAEIRDRQPLFAAGMVTAIDLASFLPVHRWRVIVDAPAALPLRYEVQQMPDLTPGA